MQQALMETPGKENLLQDYFNEAVAVGQVQQAVSFLDGLLEMNPSNHSIRRMLIALLLTKEDYPAAMDDIETLVAFSTPDDRLIESALAIRAHLGPRFIDTHRETKTSISLCMIVRDELAFLGLCLNAVKSLVDEIIVVDTGSKDRSVDIAQIYGAKVYHEKWQDDFALARNKSLEKAGGDWILILDADEVIARQDFCVLQRMISSKGKTAPAFSLQTRNYINLANAMDLQTNDGRYPRQEAGIGWFPTNKVRLFPNNERIRFDYPVHELVEPSLHAAGLKVQKCFVPIHHYGHLNAAKNIKKAKSYFALGYAKLEQMGNDKTALRELAIQAGQLEKWHEAIELWHRFLKLVPKYGEAYANIAGAHWHLGQYDQGIEFSKRAIAVYPEQKEGHYNLAVNLLMSGQPVKAVEILRKLLRRHPDYLAAQFMLGAALGLDNKAAQSWVVFQTLEKMMSSQALAIAIKDLQDKLSAEGQADAVKKIAKASGLNPMVKNYHKVDKPLQYAGMRLLNHGLRLIKKGRILDARAFIELPLRTPKEFKDIDLNPIRRIYDHSYPVDSSLDFYTISTKNRTAVLLGSGPSIKLIKNTISAEIDVWTFNNFAIHPKIVPDFYHIEVSWGRPEKMAWFQSILETKKQIYRQTKFLVHEKEYPSYRIFIPNDLKLLHYDKLKTNNPHGTCSLGRLLALMHHLSYETIYMVGIDLYCAEYFWANYDGIPDFMRCNKAEEGRQPWDLHATVLKNDIVNAVSMFIHANQINVVNLSPESLFAERLPTESVAVLY